MKNFKILYSIVCITALLFACKDDDVGDEPPPFPPLDKGEIEVNRYLLTIAPKNNPNQKQTVEFYDPDGVGGTPPIIQETLLLINPTGNFTYTFELAMFKDSLEVTKDIIARGTSYIICYRDFNPNKIKIGSFDEDAEGVVLGTEAKLSTADEGLPDDGRGDLRITLNYQPSGKEGLCDPGVRIFEGSIPYQIN